MNKPVTARRSGAAKAPTPKKAPAALAPPPAVTAPTRSGKLGVLMALLSRPQGAELAALMDATAGRFTRSVAPCRAR